MKFWRRISPFVASSDLVRFLRDRHPHQWVFLVLSFSLTWAIMLAMIKDSKIERPYKRDIVYFQNWRADRSDAEILAQQKIDAPKEKAAKDAADREAAERRASYRRLDEKMTRWGL